MPPIEQRLTLFYYLLATPVFLLLDSALDLNLRAAFTEDWALKGGFYTFLVSCGLLVFFRPSLEALVGIGESSVSIFLLIYTFMKPLLHIDIEAVEAGGDMARAFNTEAVLNFLIVGLMLLYQFHRNVNRLRRGG